MRSRLGGAALVLSVGLLSVSHSMATAQGGDRGLPETCSAQRVGPTAGQSSRIARWGGGWVSIRFPSLMSDPEIEPTGHRMMNFHPDPENPLTIVVSSMKRAYLTSDGGCNWRKVFAISDHADVGLVECQLAGMEPRAAACSQILSIELVPVPNGPPRIYMQVVDRLSTGDAGVVRTHLFISENLGRSWTLADNNDGIEGLKFSLGWGPLAFFPGDSDTVYAMRQLDNSAYPPARLYVSHDGGYTWGGMTTLPSRHSWEKMADAAKSPAAYHPIFVGAHDPRKIWVRLQDGFFRSQDAGATWERVPLPDLLGEGVRLSTDEERTNAYQVFDWLVVSEGRGTTMLISTRPETSEQWYSPNPDRFFFSKDEGVSWVEIKLPRDPLASAAQLALGASPRVVFVIELYGNQAAFSSNPASVLRVDTETRKATNIRLESMISSDLSLQVQPHYSQGALYFLTDCGFYGSTGLPTGDLFQTKPISCKSIDRFTGRGT